MTAARGRWIVNDLTSGKGFKSPPRALVYEKVRQETKKLKKSCQGDTISASIGILAKGCHPLR
jgi:hypothetical protein